jgi:hyperosmotically inducible periplasmic protein
MLNLSFRTYMLSGLLMALAAFTLAESLAGQSPASPDNTGVNRADRNSDQPTADQQQKDRSDRDLTEQIRRSIIADKSLSTDAHNVKVIARGGQVTLKGPVRSESEKRAVEAKAAEVAGEDKVTSELAIKAKD